MRAGRLRFSGVTFLAATVLVLLPALAWLQYSWLAQIAGADRERRERTLQTAALQLGADLDGELSRTLSGLQIDASTVQNAAWSGYAARYSAWAAAAANPGIVRAVYLVELPPRGASASSGGTTLRVWTPSKTTFEAADWPDDLAALRARVKEQAAHGMPWRRGDRVMALSIGDDRTLIAPIVYMDLADAGEDDRSPNPRDVRLLGFTVIRLDADVVRDEVLPALVRRHFFDAAGAGEYRVAIVQREQPGEIVYESEPGAAAAALAQPDASAMLMAPRLRPTFFMARERPALPAPEPPGPGNVVINLFETRVPGRGTGVQMRAFTSADGHWRLVVKHRAGSLEAAVAATRARNFALSSGILVLLAAAIGLIVVSARRADRLARQQMDFVAAVSHELRTPVSVIGAAAGNLADGVVGDPARVKKYGATIQGEARRLAETVERALQLAGIAAGRAAAAPMLVAPADLVADALDACRADIEAAGVQVETDVDAGLPLVAGDVAALRSALQNLVSNAVKYGRDGRQVRITVRRHGRFVELAVADRGPGVAAADRRHIFEPFYRGREAVARQIQGSGLGLHLVQRIAEAHGGTVSVATEPGGGARFTLSIADGRLPI